METLYSILTCPFEPLEVRIAAAVFVAPLVLSLTFGSAIICVGLHKTFRTFNK